MLTVGINVSNLFSPKTVQENYFYAYIFMGFLDAICLALLYFVFKTRPFEEDVEQGDEGSLLENLKTQYNETVAIELCKGLLEESKNWVIHKAEKFSIKDQFGPQTRVQMLLVIFLNILNQLTGINLFV